MNTTPLAPGAELITVPGEKFKNSTVVFNLVLPSERQTATALALLPSVLERRCEAIPSATALNRHLFDLYGASLRSDSFVLGPNRVLSLAVSGIKNDFALQGEDLAAEYLKLACRLLFEPKLADGVFESDDVAIEKGKLTDTLKSEMNNKRTYCLRQARRKLYGTSRLGIESKGYLDEVPSLTPQALHRVYQDFIEKATVYVMLCNVDEAAAKETVAAYLQPLNRQPVAPAKNEVVPQTGTFERYTEAMDTAQGKLCILLANGQDPTPQDQVVMRVANAVLGGLPSSRLFINVRELQSLCYYCASSYGAFNSIVSLDSGVDHEDAEKAAAAMLHELEQLQQQPVTEPELHAAHLALKNAYAAAQDNADALLNWAFLEHMRGSELTLSEMGERVGRVTADDVQSALATFTPQVQYLLTGKEQ